MIQGGERAAQRTDKNLRVGLKASLDLPKPDQTLPRSRIRVSGWAVHRDRYIRGVLIELDGVPVAVAPRTVQRPDVAAAYPEHTDTDEVGFATLVDLAEHDGEFATLTVSVVLGPDKQSDPRRGRPPMHRDSRVLPMGSVTCHTTAGMARMSDVDSLSSGWQRWGGVADVPQGVARVDMLVDGVVVGPARVALPGRYDEVVRAPESRIGRFEITAPLPSDRPSVRLGARIVSMEGSTVDTPEIEVALLGDRVGPAESGGAEPARSDAESESSVESSTPVDKPTVLVLTHDLGLGGAQLFLSTLLDRLDAAGVRCAVASHNDGLLRRSLEDRGWPVLVTGALDFSSDADDEERAHRLRVFAAEHGCQVALANTTLTFPEVQVAQELGMGVVWAVHESYPRERFWLEFSSERPPAPHHVKNFDRTLATADRVVFVSEATRALYRDRVAESADVVMRYGIDLDDVDDYRARRSRQQVRDELGYAASTRLLLCLGMVTPLKGQIALAQAFAGSAVLRDRDVALAFVGATGGPYLHALMEYVDATGDPRLRVVPMDSDSFRWHLACDVLVNGSDNESMPRTMIEAMAFERPVAAPRVFGVPELVEDGATGFLCAPSDVRELRSVLERAGAADADILQQMGQRARRAIESRNDATKHAEYFESELKRLARKFKSGN